MTVVVNIVSCFLGLLFACSAVSSKSVQLEDQGHLDIRPAHSHHESLAMKNTAVESQYKYQSYHVDDYNGLGFTQPSVIPTRLKGTARKLAVVSKTRNEDQRTEKKNSLYTVIRNGGGTMKNTVNKLRASRKIKHRPFSSSGARSMHTTTTQDEPSKRSESTSLVAKKINVVDLNKHHHREKYDQLPNLNADYHGPKTHPPKHN